MSGIEPVLFAGGVWLWENYGKDAFSWLVRRLAKRTEELKDAGWEKIDWALASRRYREELSRLYGTMHIFGMSQPVPLGDIFTDAYLLDKPSAWRRHAIEELQGRSQTQYESLLREQRRDGVALVQSQKRLFILGQPGAGKTTFLKYLVTQAVAGKLDAIPIFVSLKAWSDAGIDLLPFLVRQFAICNFPDAQPFIEQILADGKAIVLFDGLDEVNVEGGARLRLTDAVRDFARQYGNSRVLITCRTAATEYVFEGFSYCELAEFTQEQIEAFVGRWFQKDQAKREAFWKAFMLPEHERLRELGRRPLLLTMLCLTFEETMAFPRRRAELYEEAIDALLKKWDSSRSIQRDTVYRKLSLGYKRQLLIEIAAETFQRGEQFMRKRDLAARVSTFLRRLPPADGGEDVDGEAVLRSIEAQHGLLIERAHDIYSFSHLTFHEYFAARYIADHPELSVLRGAVSHAADPRWREVLLLTASMLDYRNVARLFDCWCEQLEQDVLTSAELEAFVRWADSQSASSGRPRSVQVRAMAMMAALLDWVYTQADNLVRADARSYARGRADALTNAYPDALTDALADALADAHTDACTDTLARAHADALARVLTRAHADARPLDLDLDLTRARAITRALAFARDLAPDLPDDHDHNHNPALFLFLATTPGHDLALARAFARASALSRIHTSAQRAQANEAYDATDILAARSSQTEHISLALLDVLGGYLASAECLLECLDLAVVDDRDAILDRLLLAPEPPSGPNQLRSGADTGEKTS